MYVINHMLGDRLVVSNTDQYLKQLTLAEDTEPVHWTRLTEKLKVGWICVKHAKVVCDSKLPGRKSYLVPFTMCLPTRQ